MRRGGNASLVVKGSEQLNGKEIYALKMFDLTKGSDDAIAYTLDVDWEDFFKSVAKYGCQSLEGEALSRKAYEYVAGLTNTAGDAATTELSTFASEAADYVLKNPNTFSADRKTATGTETSPGEYQAKFDSLDYGYYLVYPLGSTGNGTRDTYAMLYNVNKESVEISMKSEYPTVDKEIVEDNGAVSGNTAQIGDTLTFTLTAKVPDVSAYDEYYRFAFVDTLSKGLQFNSITSVQWAESENGQFFDMGSTNYTVTAPNYTGTRASELRIDFGTKAQAGDPATAIYNALTLFQDHKGWTIKVTYTVTLTDAAVVVGDANTNSAKVEFTTDPDSTGTGSSTEDITKTYTFGFGIDKQKGNAGGAANGALAGAVFKIYKDSGTDASKWDSTDSVVKFKQQTISPKAGFDYYTVDASGNETLTTTKNKLYVCGLEPGTYWIEEVSAPDGYNKMAGYMKVVIEAVVDESTGELTSHKITFTNPDGTEVNPQPTHDNDHTIQIINKTGQLLPETGGMGTIVFTVAGVAIAAGGIVWFASRRRANGSHAA